MRKFDAIFPVSCKGGVDYIYRPLIGPMFNPQTNQARDSSQARRRALNRVAIIAAEERALAEREP
jgi:hypothetical protein